MGAESSGRAQQRDTGNHGRPGDARPIIAAMLRVDAIILGAQLTPNLVIELKNSLVGV